MTINPAMDERRAERPAKRFYGSAGLLAPVLFPCDLAGERIGPGGHS